MTFRLKQKLPNRTNRHPRRLVYSLFPSCLEALIPPHRTKIIAIKINNRPSQWCLKYRLLRIMIEHIATIKTVLDLNI